MIPDMAVYANIIAINTKGYQPYAVSIFLGDCVSRLWLVTSDITGIPTPSLHVTCFTSVGHILRIYIVS